MKIISITNQKGGVAKTTTALALSYGLADAGKKVLAIDLDPQHNFTDSIKLSAPAKESIYTLFLLANQDPWTRITNAGIIDVIPATDKLADLDIKLTETGKEYRLREALDPLRSFYDYVIIDTPPALNLLTVNALTCTDGIIIPAQADAFSISGITGLLSTVNAVKKYTNPAITVDGILLTRYNPRAVLSRNVSANLEEQARTLGTRLFRTKIRECTAVKEAQLVREPIFTYNRKCNASMDYTSFIAEYLSI